MKLQVTAAAIAAVTALLLLTGCPNGRQVTYIALGNNSDQSPSGIIRSSYDGTDWETDRTQEFDSLVRGVAFGDGRFVVVAPGYAYHSTDGLQWSEVTPSVYCNLEDVAYGWNPYAMVFTDYFIAVGGTFTNPAESVMLRSSDGGATWSDCSPSSPEFVLWGVAFGEETFVAVGENDPSGGTLQATMYYSPNGGESWYTCNNRPMDDLYDVAWGNGKFVAVGRSGTIVYSDDGITWSAAANPAGTQNLYGVAYGPGEKWVAVGATGTLMHSPDGVTWTDNSLGSLGTYDLLDVAYSGGRYIMISSDIIFYSDDGVTWPTGKSFTGNRGLKAVGGR
jgi:hypothetical protein